MVSAFATVIPMRFGILAGGSNCGQFSSWTPFGVSQILFVLVLGDGAEVGGGMTSTKLCDFAGVAAMWTPEVQAARLRATPLMATAMPDITRVPLAMVSVSADRSV